MLAYYIRCFINVLQLILGYVLPLDPACPFVSKYVLHIHTTYQSGILDQGENRVSQAKMIRNAEKFLYNLWERRLLITFEASTV